MPLRPARLQDWNQRGRTKVNRRVRMGNYRLAAEQGLAMAKVGLACMYRAGTGIGKNETEALKWCRSAEQDGALGAPADLGWYYATQSEPDCDLAAQWFHKAANKDSR